MRPLAIRPLDPHDDAALAAWHATYLAAHRHGRPHATPYMLEEMRAQLRATDNPGSRTLGWSGSVAGTVVVVGQLVLPLLDNLHQAYADVHTLPSHRRQGHGSAMLAHLVGEASRRGRDTMTVEVAYPYDAAPDGAGHPSVEFLRRHGFGLALGEVQRVLDLPVDDALLASLAAESAAYHPGYRLRRFVGAVPTDIVDSFAALIGRLGTEAPTGELDLEPEVFDEARIRADEKVFADSGRTRYTTVAVAPDGTVAAYSELVVPRHDPGRVYQWGTLVLPEHRGRRLGLATKVTNLRRLQAERPDLKVVSTYNAEVNRHMIAVNERMGFRPVERLGEFQRRL